MAAPSPTRSSSWMRRGAGSSRGCAPLRTSSGRWHWSSLSPACRRQRRTGSSATAPPARKKPSSSRRTTSRFPGGVWRKSPNHLPFQRADLPQPRRRFPAATASPPPPHTPTLHAPTPTVPAAHPFTTPALPDPLFVSPPGPSAKSEDFPLEQSRDETLQHAFDQVVSIDGSQLHPNAAHTHPHFTVIRDRLYRVSRDTQTGELNTQLLVPKSRWEMVFEATHHNPMSGHLVLGYDKSLHRIMARFYWPGIRADVKWSSHDGVIHLSETFTRISHFP